MGPHNLGTVVTFEVIRTLKKKQFWAGTLMVPIVIGVVIGLNVISNASTAHQVDSQKNEKFDFLYKDKSGYVDSKIAVSLGGTKVDNADQGIAYVKSGKASAFFLFPEKPAIEKIQVFGKNEGIFNNGKYSAVAGQLLSLSAKSMINESTLSTISANKLNISTTTYSNGKVAGSLGDAIPPLLFLLIFYLVILLLGNQMLTSTQEEKENRVTEMILTTLNPTTLVIGKIFALFIIGVTQMFIFALPALISYAFFRENLHLPNFDLSSLNFAAGPMTIGLLLLVSGFSLFTGTLVAVGAVMPTAKEAGQVFGAVVSLLFIPFWVISLVASNPQALIVQIFTYFPYSAPVTAMVRNGLGSLSTAQAIGIIAELFLSGYIVLRVAIRLFAVGSMEYSKKVSLKRIFTAR